MNIKLGFIGGGNMASSIISGLVNASDGASNAVIYAQHIWLYDRNADKLNSLAEQHQVNAAQSASQLVENCDVVVLAVKPQGLRAALAPLQQAFNSKKPLLVSVVAGIPSQLIEEWLESDFPIIRVMPNTPSLIGLGAAGLFANSRVSATQKSMTADIFSAVGIVEWVPNESDIDLVTALSGSGPAYFMLFIQALVDSAVEKGLSHTTAQRLALQTANGAAQLIAQSDQSIAQLIDNITSPRGTTEQALNSFRDAKLTETVADAFAAAQRRAQEIAQEFGEQP
jgi:pyrroline-5-carboxylate reductase